MLNFVRSTDKNVCAQRKLGGEGGDTFWLLPVFLKVGQRFVTNIRKVWTVLKIIIMFDVRRHSGKVVSNAEL